MDDGWMDGKEPLIDSLVSIKAKYTPTEVACGWAGAVIRMAKLRLWAVALIQKMSVNSKKFMVTDQ